MRFSTNFRGSEPLSLIHFHSIREKMEQAAFYKNEDLKDALVPSYSPFCKWENRTKKEKKLTCMSPDFWLNVLSTMWMV